MSGNKHIQNTVWRNKLEPGEIVEHEFTIGTAYLKFSLIIWIVIGVITSVLLIGFLILPIALFYFLFYAKRANHYLFTDKRVLIMRGWLTTNLTSIDYGKITDIHIRQGFMEKLLYKTGTIFIETAGSASHLVLRNLENPYGLKMELDTIRGKKTKHNNGAQPKLTNYNELKELAELRDKGVITKEDFDSKKKQILKL